MYKRQGVQRDGAFAEYITMPIQRLIASGGLPAKTLALIEPFCIGRHGIHRADVRKGDTVLVMGDVYKRQPVHSARSSA